jgi:NitT/TauT family transport system substrate-binding protein
MRIGILLATVIGALAAACARPPRAPLRLGIHSWPGNEFYFLAQEKGFFDQEGVEVKLVEHSTLVDVQRAYTRGQVDGMACTLVEVLETAENASRPIRVCHLIDFSEGADAILARLPLKTLRDLAGKRVAVEPPAGTFFLSRALEKAGMKLTEVTLMPMNQSVVERALTAGSIDAVVTYTPFLTNLLQHRNVTMVFDSSRLPGEIMDVVAFNAEVLLSRRDDIARLHRAWNRALSYTAAHPEDAYIMMARRERISPLDFKKILKGIHMLPSAEQQKLIESGQLAATVKGVDKILRSLDLIRGPDRTADVLPVGILLGARGN